MKEKNEKKCIRSRIVLLLFFVFLIAITGIDSNAGELRDYKLPSQMPIQSSRQSPELIIPSDTAALPSDADADVYEKFRKDVKKLTRQKRTELKVGFEEKAKKTTNKIEKAYYYRLITILNELGIN